MIIEYDKPFEVTEKQYRAVMKNCDGMVAGQVSGEKYFIKVWLMKYSKEINQYLAAIEN